MHDVVHVHAVEDHQGCLPMLGEVSHAVVSHKVEPRRGHAPGTDHSINQGSNNHDDGFIRHVQVFFPQKLLINEKFRAEFYGVICHADISRKSMFFTRKPQEQVEDLREAVLPFGEDVVEAEPGGSLGAGIEHLPGGCGFISFFHNYTPGDMCAWAYGGLHGLLLVLRQVLQPHDEPLVSQFPMCF